MGRQLPGRLPMYTPCRNRLTNPLEIEKESQMSVARVTEIKAASPTSFEDAIRQGVMRASKTLKNVKAAWVQNQEVMVDDDGKITEFRVQLKVTFILED